MNRPDQALFFAIIFVLAFYAVIFIGLITFYLLNPSTRALNRPLRKKASDALEGNWGTAALVTVVMAIVAAIVGYGFLYGSVWMGAKADGLVPPTTSLIGAIIIMPVTYGYFVSLLGLARGTTPKVNDLFAHFNKRVWLTMLLRSVYMFLWMLLFVIPGIVKYYSYAMTEYVMKDNPELSNNAAIEASMAMMKGNKKRLFLLDLSFTGWALLCMLTLGLGFILLYPYQYTARAEFYEELKAQNEPVASEVPEDAKVAITE